MTRGSSTARDPDQMIRHILAWPELLQQGFDQPLDLPGNLRGREQLVCCAMGGSAIGAGVVSGYLSSGLTVPMSVVRGYTLPGFINERSLVLCLSYSGDTEETLACFDQAKARGAALLVVTSGGQLLKRAKRDGAAVITLSYDSQPRATMPLLVGLLLRLLGVLGYVANQQSAVAKARRELEVAMKQAKDGDDQPAAKLAKAMVDKVPIVYGAGSLAAAARRLKGQVNENAKQTAAWEAVPEQNHNALVGYEFPSDLADHVVFVLLRSANEHPRHAARYRFMKDLLKRRSLPYVELTGSGDDELSQLCTVLFWGDLTSLYLAYENGIDPTPVTVIGDLKKHLAKGRS